MKPDLYTKALLTIIAACLVWLCVNGVMPTALAQTPGMPPPTRVLLVDEKNVPLQVVPVSVTNPSISVGVTNPSFAVALTGIERRGSWQPIDVRVIREPPTLQPVP